MNKYKIIKFEIQVRVPDDETDQITFEELRECILDNKADSIRNVLLDTLIEYFERAIEVEKFSVQRDMGDHVLRVHSLGT